MLALASVLVACGSDWANENGYAAQQEKPDEEEVLPATDYPKGLHAAGNRIEDDAGNVVTLHGVNRSGTEYACVQGRISEGPLDEESVKAMAAWHINAVRVPLNETCWLGINGVPQDRAGEAYQAVIKDYVELLHRYALVPILELHWSAPGEERADSQPLTPNLDHTPDFWASVATAFADDTGVVFEPFNEPVHNYVTPGDEDAWACWRDGCSIPDRMQGGAVVPGYEAAGIQALLEAIREAETAAGGESHLVIQAGLDWSNDLSGWLAHQPDDPASNFGAAWHVYSFNGCNNVGCWEDAPAAVAAEVPLVVTELGQDDCESYFIEELMAWLDARELGYLAWSWNALGPCVPDSSDKAWSLIRDYYSPEPNDNDYARAFRDHFAELAAAR